MVPIMFGLDSWLYSPCKTLTAFRKTLDGYNHDLCAIDFEGADYYFVT